MKLLKRINPFWAFIALILGWRIVKHFDFQNFKLQDPIFDTVYIVVFLIAVFFLVKHFRDTGG